MGGGKRVNVIDKRVCLQSIVKTKIKHHLDYKYKQIWRSAEKVDIPHAPYTQ